MHRRLPFLRESGGATRAGIEPGIDNAVRVRLERAGGARMTFARRLGADGGTVRLTVNFLALGRRQRGIVRCLRRGLELGQPCLEIGDPRQRRLQLASHRKQRQDERILLRDGQLGKIESGRHMASGSTRS